MSNDVKPTPAVIEPCPFCGGAAEARFPKSSFAGTKIRCTQCGSSVVHYLKPEAAITAWNTRTPDPSVKELREALEALRHIIGAANEAPRFGPFDQIDNTGAYYQSADFADGLNKGRAILTKTQGVS
jgi:Lar family restriction alleviation protein